MRTKPFLKWAGGKFRLLDTMLATFPDGKRFVEPFVGAGSVFLNTHYQAYLLCDCNADLISLYKCIQADGEQYITYCQSFFTPQNNASESFYNLRSRFNISTDSHERGALFLYLNRHAFNGLVRYNACGEYNVPFGKYKKPYFPLAELQYFLAKTKIADMLFLVQDFKTTFAMLQQGDVVYADPPYVPLSATANFTNYSKTGFSVGQQRDLAMLAEKVWSKGIAVILSNHDTVLTRELYAKANVQYFSVQRLISCNGARRGKVPELLAVYA